MSLRTFIRGPGSPGSDSPRPEKPRETKRYRLDVWRPKPGRWVLLAHSDEREALDDFPHSGLGRVTDTRRKAVA